MNRNILTFLNEYAEIPDPQYAIMLRGAWGCGKTFFIRQWMEQLKNNRDADKLKWQPIYVSLYGLTTTQQITEQINKEISPWLYSKGMKLAKNILKAASKIALKYDIDGDGKDEGSVTCDLDSILLLKEENSEIKGNKILIFDDLERCDGHPYSIGRHGYRSALADSYNTSVHFSSSLFLFWSVSFVFLRCISLSMSMEILLSVITA